MIACHLTLVASAVHADEPVGEVTELVGSARVERAGKALDLVSGMPINLRDKLETRESSHLTVTLRDGTRLTLAESSSLVVKRYALKNGSRLRALMELIGGHLHAIVAATFGAPNFEFRTPNAVLGVRGTELEIAFIEGRPCPEVRTCLRYTTVGVRSGTVEVSNPAEPATRVVVTEGYETSVACELAPFPPAPLGMSELGAPGYR